MCSHVMDAEGKLNGKASFIIVKVETGYLSDALYAVDQGVPVDE